MPTAGCSGLAAMVMTMSDAIRSTAYVLVLSGVQMSAGTMTFSIRDRSAPTGQMVGTATISHTRRSGEDILRVDWPDQVRADRDVSSAEKARTVTDLDRFAFFEWLRLAQRDVQFVAGETTWSWAASALRLVVAGKEYIFPSDAIGTLRVLAGR